MYTDFNDIQQAAINYDNDEDDDILMINNNNNNSASKKVQQPTIKCDNDYDNIISALALKSKKKKIK